LNCVTLQSPAKINLRLEIIGKRDDGYHDIKTVFQKISLYDTLTLKVLPTRSLVITADDPVVPVDDKNLAYRAAVLLFREQRLSTGISINIQKKIPVGAGLGGGSSNAATTLLGLNTLLQLHLSSDYLQNLAKKLGADVPFFISSSATSRAAGIGEMLQPIKLSQTIWLLVVFPGFEISTAWAYKTYDASKSLTKKRKNNSIDNLVISMSDVLSLLSNDFEPVVEAYHPEITIIKQRLVQAGASGAMLSGSGSSVFGVFATQCDAEQAWHTLSKHSSYRVFLIHSLG